MRSVAELKRLQKMVNEKMKQEAVELKLGTDISLSRLKQNEEDPASGKYWAMLEFREFCRRKWEEAQAPLSATALIINGARQICKSPMTTKRYMQELRAYHGALTGTGDAVEINWDYVPVEEDSYWLKVKPEEKEAPPARRRSPLKPREDVPEFLQEEPNGRH